MIEYDKIIINIPKEEKQLVNEACQIDKRTIASFVRKAVGILASDIIKQNEKQTTIN